MVKTIRVEAKDIDGFECLVKSRWPTAVVSPGRKVLNRDETINAQYYTVKVDGLPDDAMDHFWKG